MDAKFFRNTVKVECWGRTQMQLRDKIIQIKSELYVIKMKQNEEDKYKQKMLKINTTLYTLSFQYKQ